MCRNITLKKTLDLKIYRLFSRWLLLQLSTLPRGRENNHKRAMSELHVSQPNVDVLPEGVSLHQGDRPRLHGREATGPVLPGNHLSRSPGPTVDLDDEFALKVRLHRTRGTRFNRARFPRHLRMQRQRAILRRWSSTARRLQQSLRAVLLHQKQDYLSHAAVHSQRGWMPSSLSAGYLLSRQV